MQVVGGLKVTVIIERLRRSKNFNNDYGPTYDDKL